MGPPSYEHILGQSADCSHCQAGVAFGLGVMRAATLAETRPRMVPITNVTSVSKKTHSQVVEMRPPNAPVPFDAVHAVAELLSPPPFGDQPSRPVASHHKKTAAKAGKVPAT